MIDSVVEFFTKKPSYKEKIIFTTQAELKELRDNPEKITGQLDSLANMQEAGENGEGINAEKAISILLEEEAKKYINTEDQDGEVKDYKRKFGNGALRVSKAFRAIQSGNPEDLELIGNPDLDINSLKLRFTDALKSHGEISDEFRHHGILSTHLEKTSKSLFQNSIVDEAQLAGARFGLEYAMHIFGPAQEKFGSTLVQNPSPQEKAA